MPAQSPTCAVCGDDEASAELLAECFECGASYHLNPYNNRPGRDCGDAIIGETLGVHYYCEPCLVAMDPGSNGTPHPLAGLMPGAPAPPRAGDEHADEPSDLPARAERPLRRRRYRRIDSR